MELSIEKILSELVFRVAKQFNLDLQDALGVVAQSKLANELANNSQPINKSIDELSNNLYKEIASAE
ncbi:MAG: hypothetical protein K2K27_03375 [Muribaculaceae bacterium]|nr:hypothetical protein [Muribaculaceae bacterium]MDE6643119.1 hypothetical protein [Muribaculaceae bacterium]